MPAAPWWWDGSGPAAAALRGALTPAGWAYGAIVARRMSQPPAYRSRLPVLCVGNVIMGGAGKTPTVIALARWLAARGRRPAILTRGYGGRLAGPARVSAQHDATQIGDEAPLLAAAAPTFVARHRPAGARAIEASDADIILLDDGLQNPSLGKTLSLVAVDGAAPPPRGIFPAGALRAGLAAQLAHADAVLVIGGGGKPHWPTTLPVFAADLVPAAPERWHGRRVVAYAGIGRPAKLFASLAAAGARVVAERAFADHHVYTAAEAAALLAAATATGAELVTTAKDRARLAGRPQLAALAAASSSFDVELQPEPAMLAWLAAQLAL